MRHSTFSMIIVTIIFLSSCSTKKIVKQNDSAIIAISATSSGLGAKGYGILITVENINTKDVYKSLSISPLSPHSIIQNIPPGEYLIKKIEVPVGGMTYINSSENVTDFFGHITIKPDKKYYLGNFNGTRAIGRQNVLSLRIDNNEIPEGIREKIENQKTGWTSGEFVKLYPYKKEELLAY